MIVAPITKRTVIIMSIQLCLISWMNINYVGIVERKDFLSNTKDQYDASQCGEDDCSVQNKKNLDYYEYLCLTYFTDEH